VEQTEAVLAATNLKLSHVRLEMRGNHCAGARFEKSASDVDTWVGARRRPQRSAGAASDAAR